MPIEGKNLNLEVSRKEPQGRLSFLKNPTCDLKCNFNGHTINVLGVNCYNPIIAAIINIFNKLFGDIYRLDTIEKLSGTNGETIFLNKHSLNKKINDAFEDLKATGKVTAEKIEETGLAALFKIQDLIEEKEKEKEFIKEEKEKEKEFIKKYENSTGIKLSTKEFGLLAKWHAEAIDRKLKIENILLKELSDEYCKPVCLVKLIDEFLPEYSIKRFIVYKYSCFTLQTHIPMSITHSRCLIELSDGRMRTMNALDKKAISILYYASERGFISPWAGDFSPCVSSTNDISSDDIIKKRQLFFYNGQFSQETSPEDEQIYD